MSQFNVQQSGVATQKWTAELKAAHPGLVEVLKGTQVGQSDLEASQAAFTDFFKENLAALQLSVPMDERALNFAQQQFSAILEATFEAPHESMSKYTAHTMMKAANDDALALLQSLTTSTATDWERTVDAAAKDDPAKFKVDVLTAKLQLHQYIDGRLAYLQRAIREDQTLGTAEKQAKSDRLVRSMNELEASLFKTLDEGGRGITGDKGIKSFMDAVRNAQIQATSELIKLTEAFTHPDITPTLHLNEKNELVVIRKAPTIENLVLAGGGAKGEGNPPALDKLDKTGLVSGLKQVIGTSAGALTASLLASGHSTEQISKLLESTDINGLKKDLPNFSAIYPGIQTMKEKFFPGLETVIEKTAHDAQNSAQVALLTLDMNTADNVHAYVASNRTAIHNARELGRISADQAEYLIGKFSDKPVYDSDRTGKMVTFKDLALLHQVAPEKFKELTLTGWNKDTRAIEYFNAQDWPEMPVAFAGRISMSIPVFFQTVEFQASKYMDGGVGNNMPANVVFKDKTEQAMEDAKAKTMLMVFDDAGEAFKTQFLSGNLEQSKPKGGFSPAKLVEHLFVKVTSHADGGKTDAQDKKKIYASGPNVHIVFHGNLDTFALDAGKEAKQLARQTAALRSLEQIEARQNQAYAITVKDVNALYGMLTQDEKQAIYAKGEPSRDNYVHLQQAPSTSKPYQDSEQLYLAAKQLYNLVALDLAPAVPSE